MDKTDWQIIKEISDRGSISKVAEALFVSQPGISYRINKMEEEFGIPLFVRSNKGIRLTDAGRRLLTFANKMLRYNYEITEIVKEESGTREGTITIGSTTSFMNICLIHQLRDFNQLYPKINVNVVLKTSPTLLRMLENGELRITVYRGEKPPSWHGCSQMVFREPLVIIANEPITADYLSSHPLISNSPDAGKAPVDSLVDAWISRAFLNPPPQSAIRTSGDSRTSVNLVRQGFGWSVISSGRLLDTDGLYSQIILQPDGTPYYFETWLLYTPDLDSFDVYRHYLNHILQYFQTSGNR
ncbi:MAG: LysR family transcriptional regulator [Oscillospiraceae bacterium]|nr:LysR family transcriptional regulator [Oscillospiraceae bacterium]MBR6208694.1 LysR family transcriptional regulator [Oscillospiraceae bacterium]